MEGGSGFRGGEIGKYMKEAKNSVLLDTSSPGCRLDVALVSKGSQAPDNRESPGNVLGKKEIPQNGTGALEIQHRRVTSGHFIISRLVRLREPRSLLGMEGLAVAFTKKTARFERIVSSERRWQRQQLCHWIPQVVQMVRLF